MKLVISLIILSISFSSSANKGSELVDVNKNSKLSDYFKKINQKITNDSEALKLENTKIDQKDVLNEADILLEATEDKSKKSSSMSPVNKMMVAVFGLLLIAGLIMAGVQKMGRKKGHTEIAKNIKILTQKSIGPKKNLMLIRVAGETILLGVTDQNINHIKTLSLMEDELPSYTEPKFSAQLKTKIDQTKITDEKEEVDGFSVSRLDDVKDVVTERFSI